MTYIIYIPLKKKQITKEQHEKWLETKVLSSWSWGVVTKEKSGKRGNLKSAAQRKGQESPKELKKEMCLPKDTTFPQTTSQTLMTQWSGVILDQTVCTAQWLPHKACEGPVLYILGAPCLLSSAFPALFVVGLLFRVLS